MGEVGETKGVIPPERVHYLNEIAETVRDYHSGRDEVAEKVRLVQHLQTAQAHASSKGSRCRC